MSDKRDHTEMRGLPFPSVSPAFSSNLVGPECEIRVPLQNLYPSDHEQDDACQQRAIGMGEVPSGMCVEIDLISVAFLDEMFRKFSDVAPFGRGVLLHESFASNVPQGVSYEAPGFHTPPSGDRLTRQIGKPLDILNYVASFDRFSIRSGAFYWRGRAKYPGKLSPVLAGFLEQFKGSQGIAAGVCSSTPLATTLIQLEYIDDLPILDKLTSLNTIVAYLHWRLVHFLVESPPLHRVSEVKLTPREHEVFRWVAAGKTSWETGRIMAISERGIKFHLANIYAKLNVSNRAQAIMAATRLGIV